MNRKDAKDTKKEKKIGNFVAGRELPKHHQFIPSQLAKNRTKVSCGDPIKQRQN
ncbi:hypothetical protein [Scytonema hofmannii]|uniref:hypothetical protein n=1 Tax=Scytonema hofmannii TaxID=34078 RepID=UPI000347EF41|nr:hypothetical protein [Scytonema hofmannii]